VQDKDFQLQVSRGDIAKLETEMVNVKKLNKNLIHAMTAISQTSPDKPIDFYNLDDSLLNRSVFLSINLGLISILG